jgi:hypothetical protein
MVWRLERQVVLGECRLELEAVHRSHGRRMGEAGLARLAARPVISAIPST